MSNITHYVGFDINPTRLVMYGSTTESLKSVRLRDKEIADIIEQITDTQYFNIGSSDEPSKIVAEIFNLPYVKFLTEPAETRFNIVELIDGDSSFNQACRFGSLVDGHAVYCHNTRWIDAPRKCRRTWYTGGKIKDEDCPGFEPRGE